MTITVSCKITILTVAGPDDEPFVRSNIELVRELNKDADIKFVVIDNGITGPKKTGIKGSIDAEVVKGVEQSDDKPVSCRGSYQHADALNNYLKTAKINSRYLLVLDPDFYIVAPNWIDMVIEHMENKGLSFFGAPWHPKWYSKYRNFPCVHCMFIDCIRVDVASLDFTPDLISRNKAVEVEKNKKQALLNKKGDVGEDVRYMQKQWWRILWHMFVMSANALEKGYQESGAALPRGFKLLLRASRRVTSIGQVPSRFRQLLAPVVSLTVNRKFINVSDDTGFKIFRRYSKSAHKVDLVKPVVSYDDAFVAVKHLRFKVGRFIESLLPDKWSYIPKAPNYFTEYGFRHFGFPDLTCYQWEEFIWRDAPFGYHLRRFNKVNRSVRFELQQIKKVTAYAVQQTALDQKKNI